jgi:RHS repeat-associated protein
MAVFEGFHDGADCDKIFGWAWDSTQPNTAISVDIYDGANKIATVLAGDFRPDLTSKGNGKHAFNYPTPASLKNGQSHSITVKFGGTNTNLSTTPKSLNCTLPDLTNSANPASSYNAGQNGVQFQVTVNRSDGPLPTASVYALDRVFFSTNSTWGSNDTLLWESNGSTPDFPVSVLNSSGTKTVTATVNIPNVAAGTYYIIAFVDPFTPSFPNGFEPESNENNNIVVYPVTINAPCTAPAISTQPSDQTINSGQQAGLSVSATGTSPLSYQWFRGSAGDTSNPINGATSSSFTTPSLTASTTYWVRISNSCGNVNSRTVTVNVNGSAFEGFHDGADCDKIFGWAWDSTQPNTAISVDIYDGANKIATVLAGDFRPDLTSKGNGKHAFNYPTPASLKNGQSHSITVKFGGTNTNLSTTPKSLNCTLPDLTNSANPASSYNAGQNGVQFQVTVNRSDGPLPTASVYALDRVFFSTNSTWGSNDTLLWESNGSTPDFPVSVLNSSGTKTVTATVNIPNVAAGTYYIIAFVDPFTPSFPNGFEPESNENNNIAVYPVTIQTNQNPTITSSPPSGPQITTTFTTTGTHFTPNGEVKRFLTFPNQSIPQQISGITADSQGNINFPYVTSCSDTPGTYSLYLIDVATNRQSNTVTEVITSSSGCNAPTITISPQSAVQGITLSITGANFTPNGQVRRFTVFPNGVTYELPGATANSSGQISISVPTDCTTPVGSYTTYMLDVSSNKQSIRASDEVTANSSCTSTASLSVAPGSGPSGTQFRFTGNGFTRNSTVTLKVTKPDGSNGGGAKYSTDGSGGVSFVITSQATDPLGPWSFVLTDDSNSSQATTTAQYTATQQSGTDAMYYTDSTVDVTIPDNHQIDASSNFTKTWLFQNSGSSTWSNYTAVFISSPSNGNPSVNLSASGATSVVVPTTSAGQPLNFSIPMKAPPNAGTFYSYWQLQNSSGVQFGKQFYVKIRVVPKQNSSLGFGTQSGKTGTNDSPPAKNATNGDPVNTATGNYNYAAADLRVPGRGMDVELSRSYNSQDTSPGPLGNGWSHTFNIYLTNLTSVSVAVHYSDGKVLNYINQAGTNTFTSSYPGFYDVLTNNADGTWTLKKSDQRNYQFNSSGKLIAIRDLNNNQISLSYTGENLSQVIDTVGRPFSFIYSGSLLTKITDPAGRSLQFSYDVNSNLVSFRDANGNTVSYTYDGNRQLTKIVDGRGNNLLVNTYTTNCFAGVASCVATQTNGRGNKWNFVYNADGSTSVFDPLNKETKYLQDVNFNIQKTQDRNANTSNLFYDDNNNRVQSADPNGNFSAYVYDQSGNIISRTDPTLNSRQVVFDSLNNPLQVTNELGKTTQMGYDSKGNLTSVADALNNSSSTTYDSSGQPVSATDANGNTTSHTYDAQGNLIKFKDALNNTTSYTYDAIGRRISMTDGRGKTTRYSYDANDNLLTITDGAGNITTYTYDANNNRISMKDPLGNTTTYAYDENNNLVKETDAKGSFIQYVYDQLDRRISTRDKRGNVTTFTYDSEGRVLAITDPLNNKTTYAYDANGNRIRITDAKNQSTNLTYDGMNRLTKIQDSLGNTIQREYDAASRLSKEIDPRSDATQLAYDAVGNLIQVTDAAAGTAKYSYDKNRNRITQTDPNSHTSNLAYDKLNRLLSTTDPLNQSVSYTYDEVGNRISKTDTKGQTTRYTYDVNNRLTVVTYPDNSTVQFTRDGKGNTTRMVDSLGTSTYTYDELSRLISYTDAFGKTIGYQYDENGNITKLTYPDGKQVSYSFDANNRMTSLTDWSGKTSTFGYDSTNLLTTVTYPNGVVGSITYDNAGRLIAKSDSGISSYNFTLDKNGNRTGASITQPFGNQLQNVSHTYAYDTANQIQHAGTTTFGFDKNGNMASKTEGGVSITYGYDFEDRLVSVSGSSAYSYNGQGIRLQKIEGGITTRFVVDPNNELSQTLCETNTSGVITSYYVYGIGLAYKVNSNGTHYYYSFDPLGSTIAITDDGKNVINSYAYDPFGRVTNKVEGTANPFQFLGERGVILDSTGLYYMRARFYAAEIGRFINHDLMEPDLSNTQTLNAFVYVVNNPIHLIDPRGLFFEYGGTFYNITNFVDSRLSQAVIQSVKSIPNFMACSGSLGRAEGNCRAIGYSDIEINSFKDAGTITTFLLTGPEGAAVLKGIDTFLQAKHYGSVITKIARGELTIKEAFDLAIDASLDLSEEGIDQLAEDIVGSGIPIPLETVKYLLKRYVLYSRPTTNQKPKHK